MQAIALASSRDDVQIFEGEPLAFGHALDIANGSTRQLTLLNGALEIEVFGLLWVNEGSGVVVIGFNAFVTAKNEVRGGPRSGWVERVGGWWVGLVCLLRGRGWFLGCTWPVMGVSFATGRTAGACVDGIV